MILVVAQLLKVGSGSPGPGFIRHTVLWSIAAGCARRMIAEQSFIFQRNRECSVCILGVFSSLYRLCFPGGPHGGCERSAGVLGRGPGRAALSAGWIQAGLRRAARRRVVRSNGVCAQAAAFAFATRVGPFVPKAAANEAFKRGHLFPTAGVRGRGTVVRAGCRGVWSASTR